MALRLKEWSLVKMNENALSHYSADDSDNINEYQNYWRSWEESERIASMSYCDWQVSCWLCASAFDCDNAEDLYAFIMVMNPDVEVQFFKLLPVIQNKELAWWRVKRWYVRR